MSETTLKVVMPDGDVMSAVTFRNSHGFAMFIWQRLIERYHVRGPYIAFREGEKDQFENLWSGVAKGTIAVEPWEYNVLVSTYDKVLIRRADFELLVRSYRKFHDHYDTGKYVNHCPGIASAITSCLEDPDNADIQAIGFQQTSTSENLFPSKLLECTCGNEEDDCTCEENRPYNINKDTGHWYADLRPLDDVAVEATP